MRKKYESRELTYSKMKESPFGPMRKYYYITKEGDKELEKFITIL